MTIGGETRIDPAPDHLFDEPQSVKSTAAKLWRHLSGPSHDGLSIQRSIAVLYACCR